MGLFIYYSDLSSGPADVPLPLRAITYHDYDFLYVAFCFSQKVELHLKKVSALC